MDEEGKRRRGAHRTKRLRAFAEKHGYRVKRLPQGAPPLGAEDAASIIRCRGGAWLWDAGRALGFDMPCGPRARRRRVKLLAALRGLKGVRYDDPSEPRGGIDGYIRWEDWGREHEALLMPFRTVRLSQEERDRRALRAHGLREKWRSGTRGPIGGPQRPKGLRMPCKAPPLVVARAEE